MEKNFHITFIAAGVILETFGLIGIFLNTNLTWMWALIILGLIGIIIGWLEEKNMKEDKNNKESLEMGSWLKPLLFFAIFLIIFLLGAVFGSYYGRDNGYVGHQRNGMMNWNRSNRFMAPSNGYMNNQDQAQNGRGMGGSSSWGNNNTNIPNDNGDQLPTANPQGGADNGSGSAQSPFGQ